MLQFQVPQFIEVEDKVIGPLTIKQFLWLALGGGILMILWFSTSPFIFLITGIPIAIISLIFAFYRVDDRPFINYLIDLISYTIKPKLYLYKSQQTKTNQK